MQPSNNTSLSIGHFSTANKVTIGIGVATVLLGLIQAIVSISAYLAQKRRWREKAARGVGGVGGVGEMH